MRLIDADSLAEDLLFDAELYARELDNTDLVGKEREQAEFQRACKQNCAYYLTTSETIDAVPVVRCSDCTYNEDNEDMKTWCWCQMFDATVKPDGFCSYGERRDNG